MKKMRNLEIKLKTKDLKKIRHALRRMKAAPHGTLRQIDTYFHVRHGRLKLRGINAARYELIYYERPNAKTSKLSVYDVCVLDKKRADAVHATLHKSLGIKTVVVKRRELWMYKNTRIHVDTVDKLGNFIELETVIRRQTISSAIAEHKKVLALLNLPALPRVKWSYSDLLMRKH